MATLVFGSLGSLMGGPVGGTIGSLMGQQVDTALFGSTRRQGPRLKDTAFTTSSYGQPLPRHFGRVRTAGSVIWATDLVERSEVQGGGKGSPAVSTFRYSANFAIALASRPIQAIGRIWADGQLLRGAGGDLKCGGTMRVHTGAGNQPPDPLIVAAEGADRCPAYRGLAYVVFEELDLSGFYNRIPALTFEVIADADFTLQDMLGGAESPIDAAIPLPGVLGYTSESSPADDLQAFGQLIPLEIDAGSALVIARQRTQASVLPLPEAAIATGDGDFGATSGFTRRRGLPAANRPGILRYYELERDYQASLQRASGPASSSEPAAIELPATLEAATARTLIEKASRRIDWTRDRVAWRSCGLDPDLSPGALVAVPGVAGHWRVREWEWRDSGVELSLERSLPAGADARPNLASDPGRSNPAPDLPAPATRLVAFEVPLEPTAKFDAPRIFAAVSAAGEGWSGAALYADTGDGAMLPVGPSGRRRAVIGDTLTILPAATPLLLDRASELDVLLLDPTMQLVSVDPLPLAQGHNRALVGEEIVQFASARPLGGGRWRLSNFVRGCAGTESALHAHQPGEPFVLLGPGLVPIASETVGTDPERRILALGRGDHEPVSSPVHLSGLSLRPLAPVHPRRMQADDGATVFTWTRRARGEWFWRDGVDVPLTEQAERYLVLLGSVEAPLATWATAEPRITFAPGMLTTFPSDMPLHVRQSGTHALSPPLLLGRVTP
ncbi:phage tail protein [Novosphingobium panipatense]|uniref:Phage tail protein n=2 Tax=Novosphingobium panipatense TaxID=428991 RepID=A0ABY1QEQ4_9SPHN|nr:phage tail protein [Novosphingobium panipatense]SMP69285.1 Putative phage tail protein [Novosphingobium panipatense]